MGNNIRITPEGTRDLLFEECTGISKIGKEIEKIYISAGFRRVITPIIEFYDLFNLPMCGIRQEEMFKLTDSKGRLMVIRPDSTLPIARLAGTRLQKEQLPLRIYYKQNIYRSNPGLTGRRNEVWQSGIELLGAGGIRADMELISLAVSALNVCVKDFRLEIGHAGFFKVLADKLKLDNNTREDIRFSIESKNFSELNAILDSMPPSPEVNAIRTLPRLFGGEEIFDKAYPLFKSTQAEGALLYLKEIYNFLTELGLKDKIMLDLGLVQRNDYYSDLIFSAYTEGSGDAVLMGGRYDTLLDKFGCPAPAAGFAINIDAVSSLKENRQACLKTADVLVHGEDGFETDAIKLSAKIRLQGSICETGVFKNLNDALQYAREKGIKQVISVGETNKTIEL